MTEPVTVGVLALQGAFIEHMALLQKAAAQVPAPDGRAWQFIQVRTPKDLAKCDALIIPGGESTTVSLVAQRTGLLEPLRAFVKLAKKPVWGTCAGLILLAEAANRTKKGGQELIGGLNVRVNRNHFGRQTESFEEPLDLPFLLPFTAAGKAPEFTGIFIRAPVVEEVLSSSHHSPIAESAALVAAPALNDQKRDQSSVEIIGTLSKLGQNLGDRLANVHLSQDKPDIVAVKQGNIFGTSFHPELTNDPRIHAWWLHQIKCSEPLAPLQPG